MSDSAAIDSITLTRVDNGTPGEKGADGRTQYFHTKYSDDGGKTFTGNAGEDPGDWLGKYTDFTEADSTDVASYTWAKIKGEQGEQGERGDKGDTGATGAKGTDGVSPTVATSKTGTTTTISITDATGTKTATINDGATGAKGDKGDKGVDGSMLYATCSTAAATAAKVATLSSGSLTLAEGRTVTVTFTNGNTATSPTLNVAGTGAKTMKCQGSTTVSISAGASVSFTYHSGVWYVSSEPVYGSTATIGNASGYNVQVTGSEMNVRNGATIIGQYSGNNVYLGKAGISKGASATINMFNGLMTLKSSMDSSGIPTNMLTGDTGMIVGSNGKSNIVMTGAQTYIRGLGTMSVGEAADTTYLKGNNLFIYTGSKGDTEIVWSNGTTLNIGHGLGSDSNIQIKGRSIYDRSHWHMVKNQYDVGNSTVTVANLTTLYSEVLLTCGLASTVVGSYYRILGSITIPMDVFTSSKVDHSNGAQQVTSTQGSYRGGCSYMGNNQIKVYNVYGITRVYVR